MTKLYIIRHAEAEGNLYRRIHGQYDSLVTDMGLKQIDALGVRFADIPVDAVYSSDMARTQSTARAVSIPQNLPIRITPALREVDVGRWEDIPFGQIQREEPEQFRYFAQDPALWDIGSNESFSALTERITTVIQDITARHLGQAVAIFTHGNTIRTLLAHILDISSDRLSEVGHCENTGVSLLEFDGDAFHVRFMNDAAHLTPEISTFARQAWWRNSHSLDPGNLEFSPLDLDREGERYLTYRRDLWTHVHGDLTGYTDDFLHQARERVKLHPQAVAEAYLGGSPAGFLELDITCGHEQGLGSIAAFYLSPAFRGKNLGIQMIGHAVSVYRPLGRRRLTLKVAPHHQEAIGFYERFGFARSGTAEGALGPLRVMEKDIEVKIL
ncbi:MAG: bifunctional histidine phosphatase family protein/GNAT family N-acetyltransferase [Oscillospiraceae bacterium]|nr:bifunctional histidine phosphatase family protein/GNAT family N-acetyltransferase [Oscillospiraceae bacterium]